MKNLMKRWKLANEVIACITTVIIISILPLVFHYLHGGSHAVIDSYRSLAK